MIQLIGKFLIRSLFEGEGTKNEKIRSLLICFLNLLIIAGCSNKQSKMFNTLAFTLTQQKR